MPVELDELLLEAADDAEAKVELVAEMVDVNDVVAVAVILTDAVTVARGELLLPALDENTLLAVKTLVPELDLLGDRLGVEDVLLVFEGITDALVVEILDAVDRREVVLCDDFVGRGVLLAVELPLGVLPLEAVATDEAETVPDAVSKTGEREGGAVALPELDMEAEPDGDVVLERDDETVDVLHGLPLVLGDEEEEGVPVVERVITAVFVTDLERRDETVAVTELLRLGLVEATPEKLEMAAWRASAMSLSSKSGIHDRPVPSQISSNMFMSSSAHCLIIL